MLVDQLLAIWEQRQKDQRQRDEWQFQALIMADDAATIAFNFGVDAEHRVDSRMAVRFPNGSQSEPTQDPETEFNRQRTAIAQAHRKQREERESKK